MFKCKQMLENKYFIKSLSIINKYLNSFPASKCLQKNISKIYGHEPVVLKPSKLTMLSVQSEKRKVNEQQCTRANPSVKVLHRPIMRKRKHRVVQL